ncbi:hypothetical protein GQ473_06660 [archaeon]|nr:hypothetical protein [archaeon]
MRNMTVYVALILVILFFTPQAFAAEIKADDIITISKGEIINDDLYATAEIILIEGGINGDLIAAGGDIKIKGNVEDDIMAAGGMIHISGDIGDDIRVAGGNLIIDSDVPGDVFAAGGNIDIFGNVDGDVFVAGGVIRINGDVDGGLNLTGGQIILGGTVGGDVLIMAENLELLPTAKIEGNLVYESENIANIDSDATINGEIKHIIPELRKTNVWIYTSLFCFLAMLLVGLVFVRFYPKMSTNIIRSVDTMPWKSLGVGFAAIILIPILSVILMFTIIGIPLSLIILVTYLIGIYLSHISASLIIGNKLLGYFYKNKDNSIYWTLFVGLLALTIITNIPIVGGIFMFFAMIFGFGVLILVKLDLYRQLYAKKMV